MPKLGVVKAPVLVIHGAADVIPLKSSEFWASGYPNARLLVIEKAGHIAQVEGPDDILPRHRDVLKRQLSRRGKKGRTTGGAVNLPWPFHP